MWVKTNHSQIITVACACIYFYIIQGRSSQSANVTVPALRHISNISSGPTPTTSASDPNGSVNTSRDNTATIAGSIGGTAIFILLVVILVCVALRRKRRKNSSALVLANKG